MPGRLPDRNKMEKVKIPRTLRLDEGKTFFKGEFTVDEVTASKIRKALKRKRVVRPFVEQIVTEEEPETDEEVKEVNPAAEHL